jgi:hypothetical protein
LFADDSFHRFTRRDFGLTSTYNNFDIANWSSQFAHDAGLA